MALGRRGGERQGALWVATGESPRAPRHVFYKKLNGVLKAAGFDVFVEELCEEYYAANGRPSIPPGVFFRMVLIGYFEDISSQRGIAWRCEDSRSLQEFLGFALNEETPDHSSLSRIKGRLPLEMFQQEFTWVLALVRWSSRACPEFCVRQKSPLQAGHISSGVWAGGPRTGSRSGSGRLSISKSAWSTSSRPRGSP